MSIPLPALPAPYSVLTNGTLCYTADQLRAIQREAVRVALEAAAKVCHDISVTRYGEYKGRKPNPNGLRAYDPYLDGLADGAGECEDTIRELKFHHAE